MKRLILLLCLVLPLLALAAGPDWERDRFRVYPAAVGIVNTGENKAALARFDWTVRGPGGVKATIVDPTGFKVMGGWVGDYWKEHPLPDGTRVDREVVGPHNLQDPAALRLHLEQVRLDLQPKDDGRGVPVDYDGFVCIDWESGFCWAQASPDQKTAWAAYRLAVNPLLARATPLQLEDDLRRTFNAAVAAIVDVTLRTCRAERPRAKWCFYGQPYPRYYEWQKWSEQDGGQAILDDERDQMAWLPPLVDALCPSLYLNDTNIDYATNMVYHSMQQANEWSGGRIPVIPWVWWRYHDNGRLLLNPHAPDRYLSPEAVAAVLRIPWAMGARGVVLYEWFEDASYVAPAQAQWRAEWCPILFRLSGASQVPVVR